MLETYINEFSDENHRITDIINDIDNNKNIKIWNIIWNKMSIGNLE